VDLQKKVIAEGLNEEKADAQWDLMKRLIKFRLRRKIYPKSQAGTEIPEEPKKQSYCLNTRFTADPSFDLLSPSLLYLSFLLALLSSSSSSSSPLSSFLTLFPIETLYTEGVNPKKLYKSMHVKGSGFAHLFFYYSFSSSSLLFSSAVA